MPFPCWCLQVGRESGQEIMRNVWLGDWERLFELITHPIHFPSGTLVSALRGKREERMKKLHHLQMLTQRNKLDIVYECLFLQRNAFKTLMLLVCAIAWVEHRLLLVLRNPISLWGLRPYNDGSCTTTQCLLTGDNACSNMFSSKLRRLILNLTVGRLGTPVILPTERGWRHWSSLNRLLSSPHDNLHFLDGSLEYTWKDIVRRGQWILNYFWKTCPWSLALLFKKKPVEAFATNMASEITASRILTRAPGAMWGSIQSNTGSMRLTQWDKLYMKSVKPNREILYFDLVLGIKETPGGLQFHISSDKMIDLFSIEMKAFFNYLKIIQTIITFRLSGKAEQWQEK